MKLMKKNKKWIKVTAVIIIAIGIGAAAFIKLSEYVFDKTVDAVTDYTINSFTSSLESVGSDDSSASTKDSNGGSQGEGTGSQSGTASGVTSNGGKTTSSNESKVPAKKKNWKITSHTFKVTITPKDVKNIKKNTPTTEKVSTTAYILSKFSPGELNEIRSLMAGGMTLEKKQKIKGIVYSKFSQSEVQELIAKYNKYR